MLKTAKLGKVMTTARDRNLGTEFWEGKFCDGSVGVGNGFIGGEEICVKGQREKCWVIFIGN